MAQTPEHIEHIRTRTSHSSCCECRADTERSFVDTQPWRYTYVAHYLAYIRPRLEAIRAGESSIEARIWLRKYRAALMRRIAQKVPPARAERKRCDSYLERLGQFPRSTDAGYLKRFAARGASCLDR